MKGLSPHKLSLLYPPAIDWQRVKRIPTACQTIFLYLGKKESHKLLYLTTGIPPAQGEYPLYVWPPYHSHVYSLHWQDEVSQLSPTVTHMPVLVRLDDLIHHTAVEILNNDPINHKVVCLIGEMEYKSVAWLFRLGRE